MLEVEFDECQLPDGTVVECDVALEGVDNAREKVSENRIHGVLAASHPYSWLNGLWYRPGALLVSRSAFGLTGAGGEIYTHLVTTPLGAVAVITTEMLLYRLPNPEIELPAGADLQVQVEVRGDLVPSPERLVPVASELSEWVAAQPEDVYRPDKTLLCTNVLGISGDESGSHRPHRSARLPWKDRRSLLSEDAQHRRQAAPHPHLAGFRSRRRHSGLACGGHARYDHYSGRKAFDPDPSHR
jgi:hypothetical protein